MTDARTPPPLEELDEKQRATSLAWCRAEDRVRLAIAEADALKAAHVEAYAAFMAAKYPRTRTP